MINLLEQLLDPDDNSPITLRSETGELIEFEQIALIFLGDDPYLLMRPLSEVEGMSPNEALVFSLIQCEDGDCDLEVVDDDAIVDQVFEHYHDLLREAGIDPDED